MQAQLALLNTLLAPAPEHMEMRAFGDIWNTAYREFTNLESEKLNDNPERADWWNCLTAIHAIAQVRFGARPWAQYLKQNPLISVDERN